MTRPVHPRDGATASEPRAERHAGGPDGPGRRRPSRRDVLTGFFVVLAGGTGAAIVHSTVGGRPGTDPWQGERPEALTITTGVATGVYHGYGAALGNTLSRQHEVRVDVLESRGSVQNLQRLADDRAQVAFSAADAAVDAVAGHGDFVTPVPLCTLARVYDDFLHLVVRSDSAIASIDDLRGRAVSLGATGSGTALIADRLLAAARVDRADLDIRSMDLAASIAALRTGLVDAFFWSGGLRTPGLESLAVARPVRLIPLGGLVDAIRERYGSGYRHGVVPQGMYGSDVEVPSLAVPNFVVVRADMPDPVARMLVSTLFDARSELSSTVPAAAHLDRARAVFTEPVDLHPGALEYYRTTKS